MISRQKTFIQVNIGDEIQKVELILKILMNYTTIVI